MKPGKFTHTIAVILSSISSLFAHGTSSKAEPAKTKFSKRSEKPEDGRSFDVSSLAFTPGQLARNPIDPGQRFPWKSQIVTTVFWIGEKPAPNNPVPNRVSSWDKEWTKNYGGVDDPNPANRSNYVLQNSRHGRILFTARFLITTKRGRVIDRKRLALFLGSMKLTKARLFRPAKVVGSRFAKVTASRMRSGKMPDLSAPITGNMFLVTNGPSPT